MSLDTTKRIVSVQYNNADVPVGAALPVLADPAGTADIASGKQAIDGDGNLLTGTADIPKKQVLVTNLSYYSVTIYYRTLDNNATQALIGSGTSNYRLPNANPVAALHVRDSNVYISVSMDTNGLNIYINNT